MESSSQKTEKKLAEQYVAKNSRNFEQPHPIQSSSHVKIVPCQKTGKADKP